MIVLSDFPAELARFPAARSSLATVSKIATSRAIVGILAKRCGLILDEPQFREGFDFFRVTDEIGKFAPFAIVCVSEDQVTDAQRTGVQIDQEIRKLGFYDRANIVIHAQPFDQLRPHLSFSDLTYVFLSSGDLISILVPEPHLSSRSEIKSRDLLVHAILKATPIRLLNPFVFRGPVDDRLFVGRSEDIAILTKLDASYALVGPRSIGKTSLINRVVRQLRKSEEVVLKVEFGGSLSEYSLLEKLIGQFVEQYGGWKGFLSRVAVSSFERLVEWARTQVGKVSIFVDEADELVKRCPNVAASLRRLHDDGELRFVLVGYKSLRRSLSDAAGPLFNVLQRLDLSSISLRECGALMLRPVAELGISFEDLDRIAEVLHSSSGGAPSRIQLMCHALVNDLEESGIRQIRLEQARNAIHLPEVRDEIINWYRASTTEQERVLAGCISILTAHQLPAPRTEVVRAISTEFPVSADRVNWEIQDLIIADVLRETRGQLHFTFPELERMVRPTGEARSALVQYRRFFRDQHHGGGL